MATLRIVHSIELNTLDRLDRIAETLGGRPQEILAAIERIETMLTSLTSAVAEQRTVIDSAITLLDGLAEKVAALQLNQGAVDALAAEIRDTKERLANAVVKNTPTTEPPIEEPPVEE